MLRSDGDESDYELPALHDLLSGKTTVASLQMRSTPLGDLPPQSRKRQQRIRTSPRSVSSSLPSRSPERPRVQQQRKLQVPRAVSSSASTASSFTRMSSSKEENATAFHLSKQHHHHHATSEFSDLSERPSGGVVSATASTATSSAQHETTVSTNTDTYTSFASTDGRTDDRSRSSSSSSSSSSESTSSARSKGTAPSRDPFTSPIRHVHHALTDTQRQRLMDVYIAENGITAPRAAPLLLELGFPSHSVPTNEQVSELFIDSDGRRLSLLPPQQWLHLVELCYAGVNSTSTPPRAAVSNGRYHRSGVGQSQASGSPDRTNKPKRANVASEAELSGQSNSFANSDRPTTANTSAANASDGAAGVADLMSKVFMACGAREDGRGGWNLKIQDFANAVRRCHVSVSSEYLADAICSLTDAGSRRPRGHGDGTAVTMKAFSCLLLTQLNLYTESSQQSAPPEAPVARGLAVIAASLARSEVVALSSEEAVASLLQAWQHSAKRSNVRPTSARNTSKSHSGQVNTSINTSQNHGKSVTSGNKLAIQGGESTLPSMRVASGMANRQEGPAPRYMQLRPLDEITASAIARAKARKVLDTLQRRSIPINRRDGYARIEYVEDEVLDDSFLDYLDGSMESKDDDNLRRPSLVPPSPEHKGARRPSYDFEPLLPGFYRMGTTPNAELRKTAVSKETFARLSAPRYTTWSQKHWEYLTTPWDLSMTSASRRNHTSSPGQSQQHSRSISAPRPCSGFVNGVQTYRLSTPSPSIQSGIGSEQHAVRYTDAARMLQRPGSGLPISEEDALKLSALMREKKKRHVDMWETLLRHSRAEDSNNSDQLLHPPRPPQSQPHSTEQSSAAASRRKLTATFLPYRASLSPYRKSSSLPSQHKVSVRPPSRPSTSATERHPPIPARVSAAQARRSTGNGARSVNARRISNGIGSLHERPVNMVQTKEPTSQKTSGDLIAQQKTAGAGAAAADSTDNDSSSSSASSLSSSMNTASSGSTEYQARLIYEIIKRESAAAAVVKIDVEEGEDGRTSRSSSSTRTSRKSGGSDAHDSAESEYEEDESENEHDNKNGLKKGSRYSYATTTPHSSDFDRD